MEIEFAGPEYSASDPELIKLAETANSYRDNIKTILGFWIPDNCISTWLLGMLLGKLGLKTANRKKGFSGQQVKYYSLSVEELIFATQVLHLLTRAKDWTRGAQTATPRRKSTLSDDDRNSVWFE